MDRLFSTYITLQIKESYHPETIQEWMLNIDAAEYENNMTLTHVPYTKKIINRKDEFKHWPESMGGPPLPILGRFPKSTIVKVILFSYSAASIFNFHS